MTIEDRLRQALAAQAATVDPAPDAWTRIRARTGTRHRRRLLVPALVTASAVVAGIMGLVALTGEEGAQQVVTEPPAADTPVPGGNPSTAGTAAPASVPLPETFLAVRDHATELVVVETTSGRVLRTLVDLGPYREPDEHDPIGSSYIDGLTISPDGRTAWYSTGPEPAPGNIYRISTGGGEPEFVDNGMFPQVSPNGRYLAWQNGPLQTIVIRDLETGTGHMLEQGSDLDEYPGPVAWAADSKTLAFESATMEPSGAETAAVRVRVIDTGTARGMDDSRVLAGEPDQSLHLTGYRAFDGFLGVLENDPGDEGGERFSVRDPATGAVKGTLDLPFTATSAVYDRSGRHQLFVSDDGAVLRRSGGGFTTVLRLNDVELVAW